MTIRGAEKWQGWAIIAGAMTIFASVLSAIVWDAAKPSAIEFRGIERVGSPVMVGGVLEIEYDVLRREFDGCTNGFQVDIRDSGRELTRMPVPAREVRESVSLYKVAVPDSTEPGRYDLRVRETVYCRDGPEIVDAPWVPIEILAKESANG